MNCLHLHDLISGYPPLSVFYTSVLITRGLFPRLSRKCRGDSIVPKSWKSPNLSLSVSVVAEIPASGPRLGREPAVTEGSGICPGIVSDPVVTTAKKAEGEDGRCTQVATKPDQTHKTLSALIDIARAGAYFMA